MHEGKKKGKPTIIVGNVSKARHECAAEQNRSVCSVRMTATWHQAPVDFIFLIFGLKSEAATKQECAAAESLNVAVRRRSKGAHSKVRKQTLENGETGENQVGGDHLISFTQNKS